MDPDFAERLDRLRRRLAESRVAPAGPPAPVGDEVPRGVGSARDGAVRAVAESGRLSSVELDPRLMRLTGPEVAEALAQASSAALRACPASPPGATAGDTAADLRALAAQLEAAQAEAARAMAMISAGLTEAIAKVGDRTGMRGDPGLSGLRQLLDETGAAVRAAHDLTVTGDDADAGAPGRGGDPDGLVAAEVDPSGHTVTLDLHPSALRRPSQDVAEATVAAVNAALEARAEAAGRARAAGATDLSEFRRRITGLQDDSLHRMRADTQALARIMSGIHEP
ncbi:hypothetical protein [Actinoplanes teichomyceticus]|uniref:YbaB/EbfC DNA-binding family protein n=1 Tax=Actinoplanes teichomyceticus TaxID=1867 RepID=A0A561WIP7_ACTTI|nr:hypothetical protein [Actinoplanes teichomyceticus]TWG23745.1 hypothetical protein FHX34_102296 [Actinoplanes teichomyceticus]GIF11788.1 hypothetical protein Ate01nite_18200 [Actinoplanes teichomyceticus]